MARSTQWSIQKTVAAAFAAFWREFGRDPARNRLVIEITGSHARFHVVVFELPEEVNHANTKRPA